VFTAFFRAIFVRWVRPLAQRLAGMGVTPNAITVVGTLGTVAAAIVLLAWKGWFFAAAVVIWALAMFDGLDGLVARVGGRGSAFGAVLDSTCDRFADAAVFGSLAWWFAMHGQGWLLLASVLCLVLGSVTSYIRARAEAAGFNASVGVAERTDRLIIVLTGTGLAGAPIGLPYVQAIALWALVGLSAITVGQRFLAVHRQAAGRQRADADA
jgi:CDP-diacylglycerol--glycerol-3-phosphate 3-phosphatidyltransferase